MQLKVPDADGCDDVPLPPGVAGAVREDDFIVALTGPQHVEILGEKKCMCARDRKQHSVELNHHEELLGCHQRKNEENPPSWQPEDHTRAPQHDQF